jgi:hypothetical protein
LAEPDRRVRFHRSEPGEALAAMAELAGSGQGWINFEPELPEDVEVPGPGLFSFMSARGPAVPLATWVPARVTRRGRAVPATLGLQHPTGVRAAARLADHGLERPPGWRVTQDHPKRGLVVQLAGPRGADPLSGPADGIGSGPDAAQVLEWLLRAGELLSMVPPTGWWVAAVYLSEA